MCHHVTCISASHIILHTMCIHIVCQRNPTAEHAWTLLATSPPLVVTLGARHTSDHNALGTTNTSADTGSAWDHPVTIDPSGDPTLKFQTGSSIRPEFLPYQRSESVRDSRSRRGHMTRTPSQIPHRSLVSPVCRLPHWIPDPLQADGPTKILRMWLICRICI